MEFPLYNQLWVRPSDRMYIKGYFTLNGAATATGAYGRKHTVAWKYPVPFSSQGDTFGIAIISLEDTKKPI